MEVSRARVHAAATAVREHAAQLDCSGASCVSLCRRVNEALDGEIAAARAGGAPVACEAGCNFCCHQRVSVLPHEAMALLTHLRTLSADQAAAIERRIAANAGKVDAMSVGEHQRANLACAFLVDGRCAAYESRPSVCAGFHSLSRARCEHSFNNPQDIGTPRNSRPALLEVDALADALHAATRAASAAAGRTWEKRELHQALRTLLADQTAGTRWYAGGAF